MLQACKVLVTRRGVGRDDELILESVLGEGSYGKVSHGTWYKQQCGRGCCCVFSCNLVPVACLLG